MTRPILSRARLTASFTQSKMTNSRRSLLSVREMAIFAMLGTIMFISKIVMEPIPNVHLLGTLTMLYTVVFRTKALIPIYIYVFLNGLFAGFNMWWIPYLYIWTLLWGVTMLLPKKMTKGARMVVYPIVCALHGLLFGTLYAPAQALMMRFTFEQTLAWIASGLWFDIVHAIGNLCLGLLIVPLSELLHRIFYNKRMVY